MEATLPAFPAAAALSTRPAGFRRTLGQDAAAFEVSVTGPGFAVDGLLHWKLERTKAGGLEPVWRHGSLHQDCCEPFERGHLVFLENAWSLPLSGIKPEVSGRK